ncbi:hypothetical protein [Sphingomonas sp.]|jgi:hypothetical protein|uniref:hypothetical protein n=1 Tax=Sphingomonas sp. TaxID=28214 RepID=UPI0035C82A8B
MKRKAGSSIDNRISVTVHLRPKEALLVDAATARAQTTRHDLARDLLLARASDDAPIIACLAKLIAIYHRLDRVSQFDEGLRAEIVAAVRELTAVARAEVAG